MSDYRLTYAQVESELSHCPKCYQFILDNGDGETDYSVRKMGQTIIRKGNLFWPIDYAFRYYSLGELKQLFTWLLVRLDSLIPRGWTNAAAYNLVRTRMQNLIDAPNAANLALVDAALAAGVQEKERTADWSFIPCIKAILGAFRAGTFHREKGHLAISLSLKCAREAGFTRRQALLLIYKQAYAIKGVDIDIS